MKLLLLATTWFAMAVATVFGDPLISEFMASNSETLADGNGDYPDWIELHNPDADPIDLGGWSLRDDSETWEFPEGTILSPGSYLVVFASGQTSDTYTDPAGYLHTTFKLNATGEPLALLRPDGTVSSHYETVPRQREDIAYGLLTGVDQLLGPDSAARFQVPGAALSDDWRSPGFDDSSWSGGHAAAGFQTSSGPVLGGGPGAFTAYLVESGTPGTQSYSGSLGMDFEVLEVIQVTHLGVFDDNSDGLARTITAELWTRDDPRGSTLLGSNTFRPDDAGELDGGNRFKPLPAPLLLSPGSYTIVAHGYGSGERNGNQGTGSLDGLDIDPGGGLIQFVGTSRFGDAGRFPESVDGGPSNRYAAGTFKYRSNAADEIRTDVEDVMHGRNATIYARVPFDIPNPSEVDTLSFQIGFDDGFAAWLNGHQVASRNAPPSLSFDSSATTGDNALLTLPVAVPAGTLRETGNILAIQGLNRAADDSDFIVSPALAGIRHDASASRYFTNPTPGAANDPAGIVGFVADTKFSVDRGFYRSPIEIAITTATPAATIRFTTDGSTPTETHGEPYTAPLTVSGTTVLRAAAFREGFAPTNVDTQSYLFLGQVARQGDPPGYPARWGPVAADYAMDPDPRDYARAAGDARLTPVRARNAIADSLRALPAISIVTDRENLFDPVRGIYLNPSGRGAQWERPVSVEVIGEDGTGRYQTDAGLRIMGFTSRNLNATPKLNMRLLFKRQYGDAQMEYPLLGPEGPDTFNTVALRGNIRDAWVAEAQGFGTASYIGDEWAKRAQFDLGQPAVRGTFAHVYINGIYWGLYNPTERPDDAFAETYLGGDKSEYDVVKFCCPDRSIAGTIATWDRLLEEARRGLDDARAYQRIQGNDPDGTPNPNFRTLIDIDNFIDYVINGHYHAQIDWPGNYYVIRDRIEGRSEGFKFLTWDNDLPFSGGNPNSGNKVQTSPGHNWWTESPGEIEIALRRNPEYRMRFADRVYTHYHHGGAMTVANNLSRWRELATLVRPALFAESARWGDAKGAALRTVQDHWDAQNDRMVNTYFPNRQGVVFTQLRAHGLYPGLDAPEFNRHGGIIDPDSPIYLVADAEIYYTTDGSDPRLPGGLVNPSARSASRATETVTLLPLGSPVRALVPKDDSVDGSWYQPGFDDGSWTEGTTGVGFEDATGYEAEFAFDLRDEMFRVNPSVYLRIPFPGLQGADYQSLALEMKYDDGFIAYLNGAPVASRNPPEGTPSWNSSAGASHPDRDALVFETIDLTEHKSLLSPTGNVLAIHGLNFGAGSSDFLIVPFLRASLPAEDDGLSLDRTTLVRARAFDGLEWSALNEATFIVGTPPSGSNLAVSEIMYHPASSEPDTEFIEIMNISTSETVDLTGVQFVDGITFAFPLGFSLAPGERAVLVEDAGAFAAIHPGVPIAGVFQGSLDNGGERITLSHSDRSEILSFEYDDEAPWPESPDGNGSSLVLIAPESAPNHSLALNWRASAVHGGAPGATDYMPYVGGDLLHYALAGHASFDADAITLSAPRNPGTDDVIITPQWSHDLQEWHEDGLEFSGRDPDRWRLLENTQASRLFLRLKLDLR